MITKVTIGHKHWYGRIASFVMLHVLAWRVLMFGEQDITQFTNEIRSEPTEKRANPR